MPVLTTAYVLNYLDRTNVGFAALTMNQAIGLTATQFGLGSGLFFFLGYCFLEVPSNVALYRFGARRWLSRIMISWGVVSAAMALAVGPTSFYSLRLLLGAAEAGFFPGVAFYLATWFPGEYRTRIIAWFMVAIPISSVIGGPLSGYLLGLDGSYGIGLFLPQILNTGKLTELEIGFVTSAAYAVASVTMIVWAGHVDRHGNKVGNLALACALAAVGFVGSILFAGTSFWLAVLWMTVAVSGVNAARALFWTIPPRFLSGLAAAGGLAFINSIGTMGGFVGPTIIGFLRDHTGSFAVGQIVLGGFLLAASLLAWSLKRFEAE